MKLLLAGIGGFGQRHLQKWQQSLAFNYGIELYVCDTASEKLHKIQKTGEIKQLDTDYKSLLPEVDAVDIVTPSDTHYELAKAALEAGKHVFVEKPMTLDSATSVEIAKLAQEKQKVVQVGYYYRYSKLTDFAKQMIEKGELGDIRYLYGTFVGFKRPRSDSGVLLADGVHFIDLLNYLLDRTPEAAYAEFQYNLGRGKGFEDNCQLLLNYGKTLARIEAGYIQPGEHIDKVVPNATTTKDVTLCGSKAAIKLDFETEKSIVYHARHYQKPDNEWAVDYKGSESPHIGSTDMLALELNDFALACLGQRKPRTNALESGFYVARIVEALTASASSGRKVDVVYTPPTTP